MLRSVLTKTLRDARRAFVWWSLGLVALVLISIAFWPSVHDNEGFKRFERDAPEALKAFTGGQLDFTSPAGYLDARLFALVVPLLFLVYAVGWGARGIAGEEEARTLELVLAYPISRTRLLLEKLGALTLQLATLGAVLLVTVVASAKAVSMDISSVRIADAVLAVYLLGLLHGTLALGVGAATGKRATAIGVAAAAAVAGYFLNGLGQVVDALEPWRVLSPFDWVGDPLREGLGAGVIALAVGALLAAAAGLPFFKRRDVGV
jgi:beta-exotoxin I transport system permease protein